MRDVVLRQLEYLLALSRERHFGRAAAACHVSQPTLSAAISRLEHELDVVIVQRGHRFEGFTDEGLRVISWAHRIVAERDALLADIDRLRDGVTATVRIGAIPTAIPATPLLTRRFLDRYPAAHVRIEALPSRDISRRLVEFDLDVGVTYLDEETPPGMRWVRLYQEQYLLLVDADHALGRERVVRWEDAGDLPLCALTTAMRNRRILDATMAAVGAALDPVVETDTVGALYAHVASERMASIVAHTWLYAFGVPPGMCVRRLAEIRPRPTVGLIVPDREPRSIVAEALAESVDAAALSSLLARLVSALG